MAYETSIYREVIQEKQKHYEISVHLQKYKSDVLSKGERETLHRKTFTKWVNAKLAQHDPPLEIRDIVIDLMDGKMLLNLLECLLNCPLKKEKGNMRVHKLNNVEQAMDLLEKHKVKLVGINGFDIVDGKPRAILGLMWSIILRFQVQEVMQETVTEETAKSFNVEKKLLDWCKERLKGYEQYVTISDFTSSWRNGLAFNALIHSYRPELFDFDAQQKSSIQARLDNSFKMAEKHFGVPRYLDSSDIDVDTPDKKLIIMYLTELYNYLEGNKAKERKASAVNELTVTIDSLEAVEGALNDSWDQLDSKPAISKSERDKAVAQLNKNLNEVESGLSDAEHRKPVFKEKDSVDLETAIKQLEEQKKFREDLEPLKSRTYEVLNEGRAMIGEGYFDKGEEEHFQDRMNNVDKRMQNLLEHSQRDQDKLALERSVLLKQQLARMNSWLTKAERKMKQGNSLGPNYEAVKTKLEDHQKFQEEVGDISLVASVLATDLSDPDLDGKTRDKVKDVSSRWAKAWNWSADRGQKLTKAMIDWQKFRDEELILLNWLSQKEKTLKQVANTDVADEEQVKESLELLEATQKELEEQEQRLQKLRHLGEALIEESDHDKETTKDIKAQLQDFDDCWNQVAKRVIDEKEKLINAQNKMKEMYDLMDSVNVWIDDGQGLMKEYKEDMPDEENENLKKRAQIKLEERPSMQLKVDRVNRLGKDVCNILDGPSQKAVKGELQEFNDRWRDLTAAIESYSDKGYPDVNGSECCLMRIIKRKFKTLS
ncbi:utrophin-like isoform X3 [Orbicella faveolata]|uniref:utrophin-like isoform X3 n=1 Tax=Orbicella faveolata TaxID=48498 RepID=UPI0009E64BD1|nr:utrophin-like isoform X3 [Orbicella faveolata]